MVQFAKWYDDARDAMGDDADAMVVATATADGAPSARVVLLRGWDARGFCFYTNYDSRKGDELNVNARAALVLHWPALHRQVRVTGSVERVSDAESDAYWTNRPVASRLTRVGVEPERADREPPRARGRRGRGRGAVRHRRCAPPGVLGRLPRRPRGRGVLAPPRRPPARPRPLSPPRRRLGDRPPPTLTQEPFLRRVRRYERRTRRKRDRTSGPVRVRGAGWCRGATWCRVVRLRAPR